MSGKRGFFHGKRFAETRGGMENFFSGMIAISPHLGEKLVVFSQADIYELLLHFYFQLFLFSPFVYSRISSLQLLASLCLVAKKNFYIFNWITYYIHISLN